MITLYYNQEFISKIYDASCRCVNVRNTPIRDDVVIVPFKLDDGIHFQHECDESISNSVTQSMIRILQVSKTFIPFIIAARAMPKNIMSRNLYISSGIGASPDEQLLTVQSDIKELTRLSQAASLDYSANAMHLLYPVGYDVARNGFFTLGVDTIGKLQPVTITIRGGRVS